MKSMHPSVERALSMVRPPAVEHCICPGDDDDPSVPRNDRPDCAFHGVSVKARLRQIEVRLRELQREVSETIEQLK